MKSPYLLSTLSSLGFLIALAAAGQQSTPNQEIYSPPLVSVNVDLVLLQATVSDPKGRLAPDLSREDFEIYENGVRQSIQSLRHEDVPVTVGLVVDHSGSMRPKLAEVTEAARTFVRSSNPQDRMFVVNFNERVSPGLPSGIGFARNEEELERAIGSMPATGKTALYDAALTALNQLQAGGPERKALIVISDGGDNASTGRLSEVLKKAGASSAVIYTIGIFNEEDPDRNPEVLRRLANDTGGEAFFPSEIGGIAEICRRIAHDIRNQYTLGYVSTSSARPGTWRAIRVVARKAGRGKLSVRTRSGYIAGAGGAQ
jgi:Ca-activated chloride channel homolog